MFGKILLNFLTTSLFSVFYLLMPLSEMLVLLVKFARNMLKLLLDNLCLDVSVLIFQRDGIVELMFGFGHHSPILDTSTQRNQLVLKYFIQFFSALLHRITRLRTATLHQLLNFLLNFSTTNQGIFG